MARTLLARTALVVLTACSALTAGAATAGAASAAPPVDDGSTKGGSSYNSPTMTEPLGRKLK